MTQAEVAHELGILERQMKRIEIDDAPISTPTRRRFCELLSIPAILLLGQPESGAELLKKKVLPNSPHSSAIDINEARTTLIAYRDRQIKRASSGIYDDALMRLNTYYNALYTSHEYSKLTELICHYHILIAYICKDQRNYNGALDHLSRAEHFAGMGDNVPVAKGLILLHRGITLGDGNRLDESITTFERAFQYEKQLPDYLRGDLCFNFGIALSETAHSQSEKSAAIKMLDRGGDMIRSSKDDGYPIYDNMSHHFSDVNKRRYHLSKGTALIEVGEYKEALIELGLVYNSSDNERLRGYTMILESRAYIGRGLYPVAATIALQAWRSVHAIHSVQNERRVEAVYKQLLASPYRKDRDVKALGLALRKG